ncbi:MAG: 3-methyl-2-oxobutanoate dehydrogenase subunit beta [Thermoplasmata archaeon]|nr:3-methyl-2-oxobutanoate dehydrogenase subunit beta [Thermoplasmata archaeon]
MGRFTIPREEYMRSGHVGCQGCGACHAMRYALKALGPRTIISIPACCWAVIPGVWPSRNLDVPMMNSAFEVTGASISGIRAGLDAQGKRDIQVVGWAGDGGTADIGIQALSGMVERGTNVIYIMYDNEAYMNTGIQRSSSTPVGAWTTTTPIGSTGYWEADEKKDMAEIMVAHRTPYVATANIAYPEDLIRKVRHAMEVQGPKFIQIYAPCPTGWRMDPGRTVEIARMAVSTHLWPQYEVDHGIYTINLKPKKTDLKEYVKLQGRFRHLPADFVDAWERRVDRNWERLLEKERFTRELVEKGLLPFHPLHGSSGKRPGGVGSHSADLPTADEVREDGE